MGEQTGYKPIGMLDPKRQEINHIDGLDCDAAKKMMTSI